jgi:hypothetical protein
MAHELCNTSWRNKATTTCGLVQDVVYEAWKKSGEEMPKEWCKGVGGPTILTVSERDYMSLKEAGQLRPGFTYYIAFEVPRTYERAVGKNFMGWLKELEGLMAEHGRENVRVVFGFDS